jgi:hypothetical protein
LPDRIAIFWHIDDVKEVRPDLSDDQARQVLQAAKRSHDAVLGLSYPTLSAWCDTLFGAAPEYAKANGEDGGEA